MYSVCNNLYTISPLLLLFPCCQIVGTVIFKNDNWQSPRHQELVQFSVGSLARKPTNESISELSMGMSHQCLTSLVILKVKSLTSPRFISLPSRIMQMTHSTWQQPPCLELTTRSWICSKSFLLGTGEKKQVVKEHFEKKNSKVIWFRSVYRQILIIENLKGSKTTNCRCQGLICPWTSWSTTWETVSSLELGHGISYATVVKRRCEAGWCQVKTLRPRGLHRFEDKDGNPVPKYVPKESGKDVLVPISGSKM